MINRVYDSSNESKSYGTITLTCKDKRVMKLEFKDTPDHFKFVLDKILTRFLCYKPQDLYCYVFNKGDFNHTKVCEIVKTDFDRLGIAKDFQSFINTHSNIKMPELTYVSKNTTPEIVTTLA